MAERALAAVDPPAGSWPRLLHALRDKAELSRRTVVSRLAGALGFPDDEKRVAVYYHRMERGNLPPAGVSTKVLEKLGEIVGVSAESLREAGRVGETGLGSGGEVFARVGSPMASTRATDAPVASKSADLAEEPDELDALFTGGD
jgi:hypothetical protein